MSYRRADSERQAVNKISIELAAPPALTVICWFALRLVAAVRRGKVYEGTDPTDVTWMTGGFFDVSVEGRHPPVSPSATRPNLQSHRPRVNVNR
jgi:hypothetical protein